MQTNMPSDRRDAAFAGDSATIGVIDLHVAARGRQCGIYQMRNAAVGDRAEKSNYPNGVIACWLNDFAPPTHIHTYTRASRAARVTHLHDPICPRKLEKVVHIYVCQLDCLLQSDLCMPCAPLKASRQRAVRRLD